jgi:hypothetical protein
MARPRRFIPDDDARELRRLTRRIRQVRALEDQRGALMARLHLTEGYSCQSIAAATGANEEGVRRSIMRWRARHEEKSEPAA